MISYRKNIITTSLILLVFLLATNFSYAQPNEKIATEKKNIEKDRKDLQELDKILKTITGNQKTSLQELALIKKKIDSRKDLVSKIDKQIELLKEEIDRKQTAIDILQKDLEGVENSYSDLLVHYYNIRKKDNWMMYILASESVSQAYKRMRYFREILFLLKAQADKILLMTNRLNEEIADLARKQQLLQESIGDQRKEVDMLESEKKQSQTVLSELKRRENETRKQYEEKKRNYEQLNASINELLRSETAESTGISNSEIQLISGNFEANKGMLPWPAMGTIVSNFGKQKYEVHKDIDFKNTGIDIQTANKADVYAIFGGTVIQISKIPITGEKVICVKHGNYCTVYFKVENIAVKLGQVVKPRQKIASVATTSEGSLLHFEILKYSSSSIDPINLNPENWIIR